MNLSQNMKSELTNEINFVVRQMRDVSSPAEKLYFFSALYGIAQRIINFEYDPELMFIHQVLQFVYNTINARIAMITTGQQTPVGIPDNLFTNLENSLAEMTYNIERGANTYPQLQAMVNLAYSTTGNGYYLYLKGMLKI